MKISRRGVLKTGLAIGGGLAVSRLMRAKASGSRVKGMNAGWVFGWDTTNFYEMANLADKMAELGVGLARIEFRLGHFSEWNEEVLRIHERAIELCQLRGIGILGLITSASWGEQNPIIWNENSLELVGGNGSNAYIQALAEGAVGPIIRRLGSKLVAIQIWNEPNPIAGVWSLWPSVFAQMMSAACRQRNIHGPSLPIIMGGMDIRDNAVPTDYFHRTHVLGKELAGWGAEVPYDEAAVHLYIDLQTATSEARILMHLERMRAEMLHHYQGSSRRLWVTEVGWQSGLVGEPIQAQNLQRLYAVATNNQSSWLRLGPVFWHHLVDNSGETYGLCSDSWSKKAAYAAYQTS